MNGCKICLNLVNELFLIKYILIKSARVIIFINISKEILQFGIAAKITILLF